MGKQEVPWELFMGKENRKKCGLSASMGPSDLGSLYALKYGTLRCWQQWDPYPFLFGCPAR